jgi:hypothetical protein
MISSYRHDESRFASSGGDVTPTSGGGTPGKPASGAPALVRYIDLVVIALAAPILLLIGVPAVGYGVGAGAWLALRVVGVVVDRYLRQAGDARREISLRLGYLLARIFLLALTVVLVRRGAGRDDGLTALLVIVFAFTVQLIISFIERPRSRR